MSFHFLSFFRKPAPAHTEVRFVAATKAENEAARAQQASIRCQLAVYAATTTRRQRLAETEEYFAKAREARAIQAAKRGRG